MLRKYLHIFIFVITLIPSGLAAEQEIVKGTKIVDGIAAVVNGEVITISELEEAANPILATKPSDMDPARAQEISDKIKKEILEQMIEDKILAQEARTQGLALTQEEIDKAKEALLIKKFVAYKMMNTIPEVTEDEIKKFYNEHKKDFLCDAQVKVRHIFFKVDGDTRIEWLKAEAKARKVLELLRRGKSFEELARKYSEDEVSREKGGDLGYLNYGQTIPEFERAVFSLKKNGEISDLVKTPYGYHIIKLEDRKESRVRNLDEVRPQIKAIITQQKKEKEFDDWIKSLKEKSEIEIRIK